MDRTLKSLVAMPFEQARETALELCKEMSDSQLREFWSVPLSYVRRVRYLLGIDKDRMGAIYVKDGHPGKWPPVFRKESARTDLRDINTEAPPVSGLAGRGAAGQDADETGEPDSIAIKPERDALKGFTLSFNGVFYADDLKSRIEAVKTLLGGSPDSKYAVNVTLEEIGNGGKIERKNTGVPLPARDTSPQT